MNIKAKKNNQLRIKLMETTIQDYVDTKIDLKQLVNNLESLIYSLEQTLDKDMDKFISTWGILEIAYAWMLDRERTNLTLQEKRDVKKALIKIQTLIEQYKKKYLSDFKDE